MNYDKWIGCYKVRIIPWIDKENIYCNVQYFLPGQNINRPPVWDRSVYITDNESGRNIVKNFLHSLINLIANMDIQDGRKVILTF